MHGGIEPHKEVIIALFDPDCENISGFAVHYSCGFQRKIQNICSAWSKSCHFFIIPHIFACRTIPKSCAILGPMSLKFITLIITILILLPLSASCFSSPDTAPDGPLQTQIPGTKNILLITMDTTRADSLGCYGNTEILTPNLDSLANEGVRLINVYATCPMTFPSHASILAGQYPFTHGVRNNTHFTFDSRNLSIAEILRDSGWTTAAFVGATILKGSLGLDQGFDLYFDDMLSGIDPQEITTPWASRKAANVSNDFMNWIESISGNQSGDESGWFAWVHYYDPHFSYDPPEPYASDYSDNPYYGEIAYMDANVGSIIAKLKSLDLYDNTLIIAVGDHGEGLGEHDEMYHSLWTYNSTLSVPLIISNPENRPQNRVVTGSASVVDIFPTILAWTGIDSPSTPGIDLLTSDTGEMLSDRTIYFESMEARIGYNWAGLRGIITGNEKYIYTPIPEFYDMELDPGEVDNASGRYPDRANALKSEMLLLVDEWRVEMEAESRQLSPEETAMIESLGYLTSGSLPSSTDELENIDGLPDLKTMADVVDDVGRLREEGDSAFETGDYVTAREKYLELLQYAEVYSAIQHLGEIATYEGNETEAIGNFTRGCEIAPTLPRSWYNLGIANRTFGHHEEARQAFKQAILLAPDDRVNVQSYIALAGYESDASNLHSALQFIVKAREINPMSRDLIGYEASIRYRIGAELESIPDGEAINYYSKAYELYVGFLSSGNGSVSNYYEAGQCAVRVGDYDRALEWNRSALEQMPDGDPNREALQAIIGLLEGRTGG